MAAAKKPVDVPQKATPLEAGDPTEHPALSQMGATFAERAKARKKTEARQVRGDRAEDKQVKSSRTK